MKPAIKVLMDDHQVILRMLRALNGMCLCIGEGKKVALSDLEAALDFIKTFADYCHHGKEEDLLFPAMGEVGFPSQGGPVGVMLMEHEQGRALVKSLSAALERIRAGEDAALKDAARAAAGYSALLSAHIGKGTTSSIRWPWTPSRDALEGAENRVRPRRGRAHGTQAPRQIRGARRPPAERLPRPGAGAAGRRDVPLSPACLTSLKSL